ncbi:MAG: PIN domain-containing protein [Geodermatophilaceae bacterium]
MAFVLLDSTVLIDALRGRGAVDRIRDLRTGGDRAVVSPVNVEEIIRGLRGAERDPVLRFLRGLRVVTLDRAQAVQAGDWRREYAARGQTLAQADCLIAAAAVRVGGRLATGNPRDFPMPELSVEHWRVGE